MKHVVVVVLGKYKQLASEVLGHGAYPKALLKG
jgi:hypothetical protein